MTFQPRMNNRIEGFSVIGGLQRRHWNGIVADVWNVNCSAYAGGYYVADDPRLFIVLDSRGEGHRRLKLSARATGARADRERQRISYIPAGIEVWADLVGIEYMRHLDIHFDAETIKRRLADDLAPGRLDDPRLQLSDARLIALAELIAAECENPQPLNDLYGDGLCLSLLVASLGLPQTPPRRRSQLAAWQLRRAVDFIEEHCLRSIRLEELAGLTGLSQSHFSHAFKASTGLPPHQWQMRARIERAKQLLLNSALPLTRIAAETGFADQAHFTRVFRNTVGTTPANWKKCQMT